MCRRGEWKYNLEKGFAVPVAVVALLVAGILGAAALGVSIAENKAAIYDGENQKARKAADAGVELARDVIITCIEKGEDIPISLEPRKGGDKHLLLDNNAYATVRIGFDKDENGQIDNHEGPIEYDEFIANNGIIEVFSVGCGGNNTGTAVTSTSAHTHIDLSTLLQFHSDNPCPVWANSLKVMGKYYARVSDEEIKQESVFIPALQDWHAVTMEGRLSDGLSVPIIRDPLTGPENYPLRGLSYNDFDNNDEDFYPYNSNNTENDNTWWVNYDYRMNDSGERISHNRGLARCREYGDGSLYIAPFYDRCGCVNLIKEDVENGQEPVYADIAIREWNNELSSDEQNEVFNDNLPVPRLLNTQGNRALKELIDLNKYDIYYPDTDFNSTDFIKFNLKRPTAASFLFRTERMQENRKLARAKGSDWKYIVSEDASDNNNGECFPVLRDLEREKNGKHLYELIMDDLYDDLNETQKRSEIYIEPPEDNCKIILDFTTITHHNSPITGWEDLDDFFNSLLNELGTFFNLLQNDLDGVLIASPADLKLGIDSTLFEMEDNDFALFLLSQGNIEMDIDPVLFNLHTRAIADFLDDDEDSREIRAFTLAGGDINISSTPKQVTYKGILNASGNISIKLDYFDDYTIGKVDKTFNIKADPGMLEEYRELLEYLGIGSIISYEYK